MTQEKRFCTNCGTPLTADDRFCGSCGKPVSATIGATPAVTPPVPPPQSEIAGEVLVGILPAVSRKKGLLGLESFNIMATEKRLIFAQMTGEMVKAEAKKAGKEGFFAGMLGAMTVGSTFYKRYLDMTAEAALKETPGNFAIDLSQIKKVKLQIGKSQRDKTRRIDVYEQSRLDIETSGEKYVLNVPHDFHNQVGEVLHKAGLLD